MSAGRSFCFTGNIHPASKQFFQKKNAFPLDKSKDLLYNDITTRMAAKTAVRHEKSGALTPRDGREARPLGRSAEMRRLREPLT